MMTVGIVVFVAIYLYVDQQPDFQRGINILRIWTANRGPSFRENGDQDGLFAHIVE